MAELAVTGAVKVLASALVTEAKYLYEVEDQVRALQKDLLCMQEFLQDVDANSNLSKQDGQLHILTLEMQELAFQTEDAIDTYLVNMESKASNKSKFVWFASRLYLHTLRKEIGAIRQEIKVVMNRSEILRTSFSSIGQWQRDCVGSSYPNPVAENYIHLDDEFVVGIEDDVTQLVKRLTDPNDDFQVLCIVGTGGAGKTTLASQIYWHTEVQSSFPHIVFISMSQQRNKLDLLHHISMNILGRSNISSSEAELVGELRDFMEYKRYLVVLDDICKEKFWDDIYPIFFCAKGVRCIITTRIQEIPHCEENKCVLHEPNMLTDDQMWALFSKRAVEGRHGIENNIEFEKLGKLMLQKCDGLPLAVVTLAGILKTKQHLYEWERVSVALSGEILEGKGGSSYRVVEEMLELSFLDLPTHLKPLFLYLAIIPKGEVWQSKRLIQMWIAEGFVTNDQIGRCETLEDKGMQFMSELAQRYIIQVDSRNCRDEVESLSFDGLMREFCIKKASECQFLSSISSYGTSTNKSRRVSIFSRDHCLVGNRFVRTIVYEGLSYKLSDMVLWNLESIHKDFKLLRVLRISGCANKALPKKIGNLIHLTYLCIVYTQITKLPESVRNLRNLIYLEFTPLLAEGRIAEVPNDLVGNMENLQVLELPYSNCERLGLSSERHKKLQTFRCDAGRWMMKDLPEMHLLTLRDFQITAIEEIEEMELIYQCMGFFKGSLQTFSCGVSNYLRFDTEKLMGIPSLHTLDLYGQLVNSVTIQFPPNLVSLCLSESQIEEGVDLMGVLGHLSKLKYLFILSNAYLGTQLCCTGGSFPQLEELKLYGLDNLEEWSMEDGAMSRLNKIDNLEEWSMEDGAMSRLNKIEIDRCDKLKRLPQGIRSITTLKELHITDMPEEFCWRLGYKGDENARAAVRTQGGEDSYIIQHIPYVKFSYIIHTSTAPCPAEEFYFDSHINDGTPHCPAEEFYFDSDMDDSIVAFEETTLKSGGDSLSNQTEHLNAHIPEVYIDEPTKKVQTGNEHDSETESSSDSDVGESIAAFKETTLKSGVFGGDSRSNQTEHIDDKFIQILYEPTKQVKKWWNKGWSSIFGQETGNEHDPETESGVFGGDSRSNQTDLSPISPDEVTQLTSPTPAEIAQMWNECQHTPHAVPAAEHHGPALRVGFENQGKDDNNGINKEEAKRLLFLFSEGYEFEKLMLIQLWMALGLLPDEPMEENGAYYFENLVSEGYILCSVPNYLYRVNLEKLGMEDQSCIKLDSTRRNSGSSAETLHASVVCDEINASVFQTLRGFSRLRTLLFLGGYGPRLQQVPRDLFLCYESLEALDLSGTHIKELPSSAGKMINLRYLDLSWTLVEVLPEMIDRFKKLQTLKLEGCSRLHRLPDETKGLTNLRHLHLDVLGELTAFPEGMGALVNIRTLSGFPVGTEQGHSISELKYLDHITGSFCIAKIENVQSADVAKEALLNNKKNIKKLKLRWSNPKIQHPKNEAESILQNLCPCSNLEEIQIVCYPGINLPDWIADVSFNKLVSITLFGCVKLNMLPSMGKLPSLESLELISLNGVTNMDFKGMASDYVAFPKLQKLSVDGMMNLQTWAEAEKGDYPCLLELSIKDCPKLRQFPSVVYVPILEHLEVSGCNSLALVSDEGLSVSLEQLIIEDCLLMEDRCSKDGGEDWHKIQHVPIIWVNQAAIQSIENTE